MDKNKIINAFKLIYIVTIFILLVLCCLNPKQTQTNILKAILSNTEQDQLLVDLSQKYSGKFSIIIQSESSTGIEETKNEISELISQNIFKKDISQNADIREVLNTYKFYSANLLSNKTANQIKNQDYEQVKLEATERLYSPININLLPIEEDPFLLFSDYLQSLGTNEYTEQLEKDGFLYEIINLKIKDDIALSPSLMNKEIKKVISVKQKIEKDIPNTKIYLAGAPIHTYYASSKSMIEINIICILSILFIILLCKFYFKTFRILLPIFLSLTTGILSGYLITSIFFSSIHILTFVFSTTLIGICVDYSFHFFAHNNNIKSVIKSLTTSMITTVCAFLILFFSEIYLLQQISIFTASGLFFVYLFVVLFYPTICEQLSIDVSEQMITPEIFSYYPNKKTKIVIISILSIFSIFGILQIKFNDNIKDMYKPTKDLITAEKIYSDLSQNASDVVFWIIKGNNIQNILENEENLTKYLSNNQFYALSKFVPSIKQQKENFNLRKKLYKKELNQYATFLSTKDKKQLINESPRMGYLTLNKLPMPALKDFFISENTTVIISKNSLMDPATLQKLVAQNPEAIYINLKQDISDKVSTCRKACISLIIPVILLLFIALSITFKPKNAAKILAPSILGCLFTLGILGFLHQDISLFHIMALFLITGFSIDYSVFIFNGGKNSTASNAAVLMSCMTSAFSFLLLSMTSFKLISSLGLVLVLGLISSYILSLLLISPSPEDEQTETM